MSLNWNTNVCKPFVLSWIPRGKPLNDVMWYLTCPVEDGVDYEIDPSCGTRICCSSAPTVDEAVKEAKNVVRDIRKAMKGAK